MKEFAEGTIDPHYQALIKGQFGSKPKKPKMGRETQLEKIREHMENNMKHLMMGQDEKVERADVWQIKGYCSTDCGEENEEKDDNKANQGGGVGDEDEEYYDYYDEEEGEGEGGADAAPPDLIVVGTGISTASTATGADAASEEEKKVDPALVIDKEKEELKVPEEERKNLEQMSDIERNIIAKQDKEAKVKEAE